MLYAMQDEKVGATSDLECHDSTTDKTSLEYRIIHLIYHPNTSITKAINWPLKLRETFG